MRMQSLLPPSGPMTERLTGSAEQDAIWDAMVDTNDNLLVNAVAGSGKSATCLEGALRIKDSQPLTRVTYLAFNKHIQTDMQSRSDGVMQAATYHSLGLKACVASLGAVKVEPKRMWALISNMRHWTVAEAKLIPFVKRLSSLAKQYDASAPGYDFSALADFHGLDCGTAEEEAQVVALVPQALELASQFPRYEVAEIDYDDMCWLPARLDFKIPRADMALSDESQDLNWPQQWIAAGAADRLMIVGDRRQAIYGFRGADDRSMDNLAAILPFPPVSYPLTYTRRCPKSHVRLAQQVVPAIHALPDAIEGTEGLETPTGLHSAAAPGDLVLCRTNAPLLETASALLAAGKPVVVKGRELVADIVKLLADAQKAGGATLEQVLGKAKSLTAKEVLRLSRIPRGRGAARMHQAEDRLQCLLVITDGCSSVTGAQRKVAAMFSEDERDKIVLSTVHRAKGLEADRVWILRPEILVHPRAVKQHEIAQELNCLYVALTRSRDQLYFVGDYPPQLAE